MSVYALRRTSSKPFAQAVAAARKALADEGFGILTEVDIQAKIKEKLGKDIPPYLILGACAPPLAFRVLSSDPDFGVFLPCNVCVYVDLAGKTVVSAFDPDAVSSYATDEILLVSREVGDRLARVVERCA